MNFIDRFQFAFFGKGSSLFSSSYMLGQSGPVWIDTTKPRMLYDSIPQLKTVIDRDCSMFSNMVLKIIDKDGNEIENEEFEKLIQNPCATHSMNEWLFNYKQQLDIYGVQFMYKNIVAPNISKFPATLTNISPVYIEAIATGKVFDQVELEDIIKHYRYSLNGRDERIFKTDEIMFTRIPDVDNPITGRSNIQSLQYPLSNVKASYQYLNVVDTQMGGIGILSNKSKDAVGTIILKPEEKKDIQNKLIDGFGVGPGQKRVHIADGDLNWQPMSFPVSEMKLLEQIDHYFLTIIDSFKHSAFLYSNKNGTYENVKNGIIQTYQDAIFPAADLFAQRLTKFILPNDNGHKIVASFDHLEIMKQNKLSGMAAIEAIVRALTQSVQSGILQPAQATNILANELDIISPSN